MSTEIMEIDCGRVVYSSVGEIIAVMGTHAPEGCLICDGSTLDISDYSALSAYFAEEFGSANYFGGDGETTFALPDLRGEFLRGAKGDQTDDTNVFRSGKHQNPTKHISYLIYTDGCLFYKRDSASSSVMVENQDGNIVTPSVASAIKVYTTVYSDSVTAVKQYTSRPTNTVVLYCIKYV